ncbi:unnamed protein product [Camellia sinensis]
MTSLSSTPQILANARDSQGLKIASTTQVFSDHPGTELFESIARVVLTCLCVFLLSLQGCDVVAFRFLIEVRLLVAILAFKLCICFWLPMSC